MGYPTVKNGIQTLAAGASLDIRPPLATQVLRITAIGSDQWAGVLPNAIPEITVSYNNGTLTADVLRSTDLRGWYRKLNLVVDRDIYITITNDAAVDANISYSVELVDEYGLGGASICRSAIVAVGAGLTLDIRPATDIEDILIHDFASSAWLGAGPVGVPEIEVEQNDGTLVARYLDSTEIRQWEAELKLFANRNDYITITNADVAQANIAYSAELRRWYGAGATNVRSDVLAVGAGANVDFRPPVGEEWEVTLFGGSVWGGISPAQLPDITVSLFDGTIASTLQTATSLLNNGHAVKVLVDNDRYIRINDAGGAGQNVAIAAELIQRYA